MPDRYLAQIIAAAVRLRRLENSAALRVGKLLEAEFATLFSALDQKDDERSRAQVIRRLNKTLDERLPVLYGHLKTQGKKDALNIAASESEKILEAMQKASGKKGEAKLIPAKRLKEIYEGDSIEGFTVEQWWNHNQKKLGERIRFETRAGLKRGESLGTIKQRIEDEVIPQATRNAQALARTAANNLANASTFEAAELNPQLTKGYRLVVTFDRRTSKICLAYGARDVVYPYKARSPRPPFHFSCRTIIMPVVIGLEELSKIDSETWLKKQSKSAQDEILGPRRAELFRQGRIELSDLIRKDNSIVTIPELRGVAALFQV